MGDKWLKRTTTITAIALTSVFASCTTYSSTHLGEGAKEVAKSAPGMAKDAGAAIVVRVSMLGSYCNSSRVVLTKIIDGKIDKSQSVAVGQVGSDKPGDGLKEAGRIYLHALTFNLPALMKDTEKGDIRTSYRPIAPGSYVVTYVNCNTGQREITMSGNESGSLFRAAPPRVLRAIAGANHIVIGSGQIVDAGILDINMLTQEPRLTGSGIAILLGSEAPPVFKETIKKNLPELYPKITYSKFTPYPGLLTPVPAN